MWDSAAGRLLRRYRDGEAGVPAYAEDYACLIFGLLELFQADGDPAWLGWARRLQGSQDDLFWDPADGGWFSTTGEDPSVLLRLKDDYDGAEPSATSVSIFNLIALGHLDERGTSRERIEQTLSSFAARLESASRSAPMMMAALSAWTAGVQQVVTVGPAGRTDTRSLVQALNGMFLPFAVQIPVDPTSQSAMAGVLPSISGMRMQEGRATAFVCRDFACAAPTTDPATMEQLLKRREG
jgi:uncharacterized protein YyaL (SSP411 family)